MFADRPDTKSLCCHDQGQKYIQIGTSQCEFLGSIVVSISACHAEDPGSIPGRGGYFFEVFVLLRRRTDREREGDIYHQYTLFFKNFNWTRRKIALRKSQLTTR